MRSLKSYSVEPLDQEACFTSAYSDELDFEDGCIRAMAERAGVDFIITRDAPLLCARPQDLLARRVHPCVSIPRRNRHIGDCPRHGGSLLTLVS
ncbi:MAG: hypothetical protein ACLU37_05495 [Collinsella sp.]